MEPKNDSKVRISTHRADVPHFKHEGLEVGPAWQEIDLDQLPENTHKALVDHLDRFVKVHPHDEEKLKSLGVVKDEHGKYSDEGRAKRLALPRQAREEADAAVARAAAAAANGDDKTGGERGKARDQAAEALEGTVAEHGRSKRATQADDEETKRSRKS